MAEIGTTFLGAKAERLPPPPFLVFEGLKQSVNLNPRCSPAKTCDVLVREYSASAIALTDAVEFVELRHGPRTFVPLNYTFLAHNAWVKARRQDNGNLLQVGIQTLKTRGVCPRDYWESFSLFTLEEKPDARARAAAFAHRITVAENVIGGSFIGPFNIRLVWNSLVALNEGYPVMIKIPIYDSYFDPAVRASGDIPTPNPPGDAFRGWHYLTLTGYYSWEIPKFRVKNTEGRLWGKNGFGSISSLYVGARGEIGAVEAQIIKG